MVLYWQVRRPVETAIDAVTTPYDASGSVGVASSVDMQRPPSSRVNAGVQPSPSVGLSVRVESQPRRATITRKLLAESFYQPNNISIIRAPPISIQLFSGRL